MCAAIHNQNGSHSCCRVHDDIFNKTRSKVHHDDAKGEEKQAEMEQRWSRDGIAAHRVSVRTKLVTLEPSDFPGTQHT